MTLKTRLLENLRNLKSDTLIGFWIAEFFRQDDWDVNAFLDGVLNQYTEDPKIMGKVLGVQTSGLLLLYSILKRN